MYDTWESYFYPETYNPATGQGTLRNLYGERDAVALSLLEYAYTLSRASNLTYGIADVERTFDAEHLRAIHRYLFQDVFEWAGQYRSVNMSKNISSFADVHSGEVDQYLDDVKNGPSHLCIADARGLTGDLLLEGYNTLPIVSK